MHSRQVCLIRARGIEVIETSVVLIAEINHIWFTYRFVTSWLML